MLLVDIHSAFIQIEFWWQTKEKDQKPEFKKNKPIFSIILFLLSVFFLHQPKTTFFHATPSRLAVCCFPCYYQFYAENYIIYL